MKIAMPGGWSAVSPARKEDDALEVLHRHRGKACGKPLGDLLSRLNSLGNPDVVRIEPRLSPSKAVQSKPDLSTYSVDSAVEKAGGLA
ncbi:hypothetical protein [Caballeronia sp. LZ034LL]|uniref:hypothetical protein n=1 Tax=Caballeronia sp. LZ034LL TaxID=3038567 RepID=UPI002859644D|nr:hypothetical protein [Caballeronia sp. LZ034LL]MDR5834051.1 hypothetical protein [Caballeronia sp. LZ034LL]